MTAQEIFQSFADRAIASGAFTHPDTPPYFAPTRIKVSGCRHLRSGFAGTEVYQLEVVFSIGDCSPQTIRTSGALTGDPTTSGFSLLGYGFDDDGLTLNTPMPGIIYAYSKESEGEQKQYLEKYDKPCSDALWENHETAATN